MIPTAGQHWPIECSGKGRCHQGRAVCRKPLTCSGASREVDEALAQFRTAPRAPVVLRQPLPKTFTTDFGIERFEPIPETNVLATLFWLFGTFLCAGAFMACVFFTLRALLRTKGIL